ncbi:MAG: hypothetical protein L0I76_26895 [Pseudonocardia sp.]|nr:hypothetical protein [Pseudonocardia sp.]
MTVEDAGLYPAAGDERCWRCLADIDDFYSVVADGPGMWLVTCVGCAAQLACEGVA